MKIAILSRNPKLYSTRRLVEAAERRGHEAKTIDVLRCYMNITSHRPNIHFKGKQLTEYEAVIPRIVASVTFYGTAVLRQFEMMGIYPLNVSVRDLAETAYADGKTAGSTGSRRPRSCSRSNLTAGPLSDDCR